ncbi:MAG: TonB-dependent receptor [Brevundimonas sp.]|uniref:TonB-dependent receptor n=1 Tax=Brevundimonas sp. TaxID=1871086 RepID=UPI001223B596|nr:TonB-dependent receptor [Brevundimonas sp.]RZJ18900.1 MAG: TonB-dependent receptor [Brevundimonas sp.]
MFMKKLSYGASAVAILMATASAVHAQETTGSIRGRVTDMNGVPAANANITLRHEPTGTSATTVADGNGFFSARGLRVGGPYTVSASSAAGQGAAQLSAIGVGDAVNADVVVYSDATTLDEVVVSGRRFANDFGAGSASNYGADTIQSLPSISRDLKDTARLDPFATIDPSNEDALSFTGVNTRLNQLTVDGIRQNDEFGLNGNGYPTQRSPISLDAVEAVNVSAAPFSVINNGFIGGSINAVTKSGTNAFSGSAFIEKSDDSMLGDKYWGYSGGDGVRRYRDYQRVFDETVWGVTLGGPIIRDKLFFFASYESFESEFSLNNGPADAGFSEPIPLITSAAVETFRAATQARYDYDPGSYVNLAPPVQDEKYLAKIDWNITDNHRLAVTFQETQGTSFNGSTSSAFVNGGSTSPTSPRQALESSQYLKDERLTTWNAQLNSQWTDAFSTELRVGYKETETTQLPAGGMSVGQVTVGVADLLGTAPGLRPQIQFGADNFRHDNYLYSENQNAELIARYNLGSHDFLAGLRTETREFLNVFVQQSLGQWTFDTFADFQAGRASQLLIRGVVDPAGGAVPATFGTARNAATEFGYDLNSAYLEDTWQATDDLRLSFGLRYDWFGMDDRPVRNANFATRNGFDNTANLDGRDLFMPRFGFNWTPGVWTVSGGIGRFSAIGTNVQVGNPFGNDGMRIVSAACNPALLTGITDLSQVPTGACTFTPGNSSVVAMDPDFEIPSAWKYNLTVGRDFSLPVIEDFRLQADFLYNQFENALYYTDLLSDEIGRAPDGRPVYAQRPVLSVNPLNFDLLLSNVDESGFSGSVAFTAQKDWKDGFFEGLDVRAVYTYTEAEDANPMTSSQPDSSYMRFASADHNNPVLATSDYEIRHRFSVNAHWARKLFGDNETSINVFGQRRSGLPFSYVFHNSRDTSRNQDNDFGNAVPQSYSGALGTSNQLFYVPQVDSASGLVTATSDPNVVYSGNLGNADGLANFNAFLQNTGLIKYAGAIAPRNAFRTGAVTTFDLRLSQEISVPYMPTGKVKLYMDIENFGNMINSRWGVLEQYPFYRGVGTVVLNCQSASATNKCGQSDTVYDYSQLQNAGAGDLAGQPRRPNAQLPTSTWQMKVGARFAF